MEAVALAVLLPGLVTVQWLDDAHQVGGQDTTTTVPWGATATLGHTQWRLLGRVPDGGRSFTPGAVTVRLLLQVRPMDAQGAKQADPANVGFRLRDRAGHIWTAGTDGGSDTEPAAGQTTQITVTGDVPARLAGSVVLEMHLGSSFAAGPKHWYRFAH